MQVLLTVVAAVLLALSVYALLQKTFLRVVIGFMLLSNAVNLLIFALGRLSRGVPILPHHGTIASDWANPLPQALILTAIVISFAVTAFALSLTFRVRRDLVELSTDAFVEAGPQPESAPRPRDEGRERGHLPA